MTASEVRLGEGILFLAGSWALTRDAIAPDAADQARKAVESGEVKSVDVSHITALDTAGAAAIADLFEISEDNGQALKLQGANPQHTKLLERVGSSSHVSHDYVRPKPRRRLPFETIGRETAKAFNYLEDLSGMLGELIVSVRDAMRKESGFRFTSVVAQLDRMIFQAVPIVCLITFLVGAIITQQSIFQLRTFGASIFVVDLAGILMWREVGVLLAAIMLAGRSGSAVTAELGSMNMREEMDALRVMGLSPSVVLLLPRVTALVVGMPLLAFLAGLAGLAGAAIVADIYGGISLGVFIDRLRDAVGLHTFLIGLIKAPFMAAIIGIIACVEGMNVEGSAESLGRQTTSSVVKSIFMVILADGLFAMFFAGINF